MTVPNGQIDGLEGLLNRCKLNETEFEEVVRLIYGKRLPQIPFSKKLLDFANANDFELKGFSIEAQAEQCRPARRVKVAAIQNMIVLPTDAPVAKQREVLHQRVGCMIESAANAGANIICLQEAWSYYATYF